MRPSSAPSRILRLAALLLPLLISAPTLAQQMFLSGNTDVSAMGAGTWAVPIESPPGLGSLRPNIGLYYNSQAGNTFVGWRWTLSGTSSITRCARTIGQDGIAGRVNHDANDRFCLDGQRLMLVSGVYGADSSEYRTEIDSYAKIVAYGNQSGAPQYFKVWTRGGLIVEYGNTTDSRLEASNRNQLHRQPQDPNRLPSLHPV